MANLPADLPTNWTQGQIISPNGTEVGLSEQYGYNYLNEQVNDTQTEVNSLSAAQTSTQQQVNTLNTQVGNIQGQVTTQGQEITELQQTTTTQGQSISTLQSEVSAINTALDSVAQESSVQDIIDSIGATADTGGSATAGTLMAKMNNMLSNAGAVKSRQEIVIKGQYASLQDPDFYNKQTGTYEQPNKTTDTEAYYADFNISTVDTNKVLIIANTDVIIDDGDSFFPCARLIDANTIRVYQTRYYNYNYITGVYVQIIEFY